MSDNKRTRQPARTPQEKLEDAFFDMTVPEQERLLASFSSLHRMKRRLENSDCIACKPYSDAIAGSPFVTCKTCGRKVLDSGQFFTPDRADLQGTLLNEEPVDAKK